MSRPLADRVVVVGGINADLKARTTAPLVPGTSNPGTATLTPGGVGRNVAENLAHLGRPVALVGVVGDDDLGRLVLDATAAAGVDVSHVRTHPGPTGSYTALLDHRGELVAGVADMAEHGVPVVVDPVSVPKAARLAEEVRDLLAVTPSQGELEALGGVAALLARGVALVWERRGASGSVLHAGSGAGAVELAAPVTEVVDVTGAGDAMLAAWCHAVLSGRGHTEAAAYAHEAAALTVASPLTVRPDLEEMLAR